MTTSKHVRDIVNRVLTYAQIRAWNVTWDEIQNYSGVIVPDSFKRLPCNYGNVKYMWASWLEANITFAEGSSELENPVPPIYSIKEKPPKLASLTLSPEQHAVYLAIVRDLFVNETKRVAYCDGKTGSGKTVLGVFLIHYILSNKIWSKHGLFPFQKVMIVCPSSVIEVWKRHLAMVGISNPTDITVTSYSQLRANFGRQLYYDMKVEYTDDDREVIRYEWRPLMAPFFVIIDEAHNTNRDSQQSNIIRGLLEVEPVRALFLSATPWITVNDTKTFVCAVRKPLMGITVNQRSFNTFAKLITSEPHKPSSKASEKLRRVLSPYIYSFPRVKWPHRAHNYVITMPFANEQGRKVYEYAIKRFEEERKLLGKKALSETGRWQRALIIQRYRFTAEPLRIPAIVKKMKELEQNGMAPVLGVAFLRSLIIAVDELIKEGYKREDISIILGGTEEYREDQILSPKQRLELMQRVTRGEELTREELIKLKKTIKFEEERVIWGENIGDTKMSIDDLEKAYWESRKATDERIERLKSLGIYGKQTTSERQTEIDAFQSGKSKICVFTIQTGGVGLSLDQWKPELRPRVGFFTPVYSGTGLKQCLGRLLRRYTCSDVNQYIVCLQGTVEEMFVLPVIEEKLKALNSLRPFDDDIERSLWEGTICLDNQPQEQDPDLLLTGDGAIVEDDENNE